MALQVGKPLVGYPKARRQRMRQEGVRNYV
jgi:hypothetical protein